MAARAKRGRLSSIDLLPADCDEDVAWAVRELQARKRTQEEIREELNLRLLSKGADPITKSAFNRYAIAMATLGRRMSEAREMAALIGERLDEQPDGDVGLLVGEAIKTLVYDVIVDASLSDESPSIKMLLAAAEAVERLEKARRNNVATAAAKAKDFVRDAADKAERAAKAKGLDTETIDAIKETILGVKP